MHKKSVGIQIVLVIITGAECSELPTIDNGFIIDPSRQYLYGDEARVQCHRGFKLTGGSSIIKCGALQKFLNVPKCEGLFTFFFFSDFLQMSTTAFVKTICNRLQMSMSVQLVNAIPHLQTVLIPAVDFIAAAELDSLQILIAVLLEISD